MFSKNSAARLSEKESMSLAAANALKLWNALR
jgi:hypothetical protein